MPIKPSEYRKGHTKVVTLDSGTEWLIRKIPFDAMAELFEVMGVKATKDQKEAERQFTSAMDRPDFQKRLVTMTQILLPACCVDPKVVLEGDPSDDYLLYSEIDPMDMFKLFFEIMQHSGLSAEAAAKRQKFRNQPSGESDKSPVPSLKQTPP